MGNKVGSIDSRHFSGHSNLTRGSKKKTDDPDLAEMLDLMQLRRVPSNIETAAFQPAVVDTWEDFDLRAAINTALAVDQLRIGEAYRLLGTLELVNAEANANNVKFGHGGTPDDDDTTRNQAMAAAIASEFFVVDLLTDADGNIKIEVDDLTNVTMVFHLEAYQIVKIAVAT